jgi:hypothetical protein
MPHPPVHPGRTWIRCCAHARLGHACTRMY